MHPPHKGAHSSILHQAFPFSYQNNFGSSCSGSCSIYGTSSIGSNPILVVLVYLWVGIICNSYAGHIFEMVTFGEIVAMADCGHWSSSVTFATFVTSLPVS